MSRPTDKHWYAMHSHGPGTDRHSHHISQTHTEDIRNPFANDHSSVARITWDEFKRIEGKDE